MRTKQRLNLDNLHLSDIYSLMLFVLYKVQDLPEYAVLSELCYLLDGSNLTRLLTYFAGKTITIPTEEEFVLLTDALLLYQYVNIDGLSFQAGHQKLTGLSSKQHDKVTELYTQFIPVLNNYNIDRGQLVKDAR